MKIGKIEVARTQAAELGPGAVVIVTINGRRVPAIIIGLCPPQPDGRIRADVYAFPRPTHYAVEV